MRYLNVLLTLIVTCVFTISCSKEYLFLFSILPYSFSSLSGQVKIVVKTR